ncbi:MAG: TIM-barrel domain-containing protein [Anaerocolumna sp.]
MKEQFKVLSNPKAVNGNVLQGKRYRITILTEQMIRLEYNKEGVFEDEATQIVWNRNFAPVNFQYDENEEELVIVTKELRLTYDKKEFSGKGLKIELTNGLTNYHSIWRYGEVSSRNKNLKGTARTLDESDGAIDLDDGLLNKDGFSIMDDSQSLILNEDGRLSERTSDSKDIYFFGYGREYRKCLKDFHYLTGKTPLLPRYAMGNWWSRYYPYTDKEYLQLFDRFEQEKIPFSIAVLDMDWHPADESEYGSGWTGYTWNEKLFPDYIAFLKTLHERKLKVTLNEHPADGVCAHEVMYQTFKEAVAENGSGTNGTGAVRFDITSEKFINAYFELLHNNYEKEGVDFWWLDWQQGVYTKLKGLDPLWMLNHLHFLNKGRGNQRSMIFSRYAGAGSHRYPVGFSGDTVVSWESLKFQPYFTATASNIGFNWWSHDIGGHMQGIKNDELMVRWVQFGVFSPIFRLHSTNNFFNSKEPWRYAEQVQGILKEFMRLRHRMIPFLYSLNYASYRDDNAIVEPLYYDYPFCEDAYRYPNEYMFGRNMIVAPITEPINTENYLAEVSVWVPEGIYFDFFDGTIYRGGRNLKLYRKLNTIPVLVKAGSIIPLDSRDYTGNGTELPEDICLRIYAGADGTFELYEDDGETNDYKNGIYALTNITFNWQSGIVRIERMDGKEFAFPGNRKYKLELIGVKNIDVGRISALADGVPVLVQAEYIQEKNTLFLSVEAYPAEKELMISFDQILELADNQVNDKLFALLCDAQMEYDLKAEINQIIEKSMTTAQTISELFAICPYRELNEAFMELLTAL